LAERRIAFVFPGQGSQCVGMGKALAAEYPEIERTLDEAGSLIGVDLKELCFSGPEENLTRTSNAQPAILALSVAIHRVVSRRLEPSMVAGHSLGEYSALVACGAIGFEDAVRLVRARGELMESASDGSGAMCAVIGLNLDTVEELCSRVSTHGTAVPANINCPGQIVISGHREAVEAAAGEAVSMGARRTAMLRVSGAFHSPLMEPCAELFRRHLDAVRIADAKVPIVSNVTGTAVCSGSEIRELLLRQITSPVLWESCVRTMRRHGIDVFVELGAGQVVTGLIRRIDKSAECYSTGDPDAVSKLLRFAEEERA
jgi:[acyl-carrier-protein] S-malonyltransferase